MYLDENWEAVLGSERFGLLDVGARTVRSGNNRDIGRNGNLSSRDLVTQPANGVFRWTHKDDACDGIWLDDGSDKQHEVGTHEHHVGIHDPLGGCKHGWNMCVLCLNTQ